MTRVNITITDDFKEAVREYQREHNIKSWTQALLHLAALGYERETGHAAPEPFAGWGGWRGNEASLRALVDYASRVTDGGRNDPAEADDVPFVEI